MDSRTCQTSAASPAEPGGLPFGLEDLRRIVLQDYASTGHARAFKIRVWYMVESRGGAKKGAKPDRTSAVPEVGKL